MITEDVEKPIMRYHGGKFRIANWVISHFPDHQIYCEPFGGAASVLMRKVRSDGEIYNDLDGDMVNVMEVLRDEAMREDLAEALVFTLYSRDVFNQAWEPASCPVERARRTFIRAEMGFGSAGATKGATGFRIDTGRESATAMKIWERVPQSLQAFGMRLAGVLIENRPALKVLRNHDTPETLFYVDPPYIHSTRKIGSSRYYRHEMSDGQHSELLDVLLDLKGMVIVSGYPNGLYDQKLKGWRREETTARMAANRGTGTRTEVLWISPNCDTGQVSLLLPF
ncbi:DNA adenine methylase [Nitrosovibrio sp. Nv6]|uniref:DNA adenine methylase n=1 Tax=Nitrosovibrio sp. Nv6 TaxID=1855340 RepID=UPI0008BB61E7|nr:DNA adenine methylase [Nitrosovibrio sp. Nv6]SEP43306.1 DNA adenine methylase [Nitrosovibrio sp. Nv6]